MISLRGISSSYGKKQVLHDVSLELERGKLYAIVGKNGSGKTTLLHTLARLHKAEGELMLDGEKYGNIGRREFAKKLAILPQERSIPDMTVFDLAASGRYPYLDASRRLSDADTEAVAHALSATNTEHFADESMKKLSGGERQRAYIAMLLAQDTPYVLLDEPTSHLDAAFSFEIMEHLCKMRDAGKCVVAVLHDLPLALRYADRLIVVSDGRIIASVPPEVAVRDGVIDATFDISCQLIEDGINGRMYVIKPLGD